MNGRLHQFAGRYSSALSRYLAHQEEAELVRAYAWGRAAVAGGLGVLDVAQVHEEIVQELLQTRAVTQTSPRSLQAARVFFLESLSPFEVTHRGFRETNARLQQTNEALEKRNRELQQVNQDLAGEITGHKRTEQALRESERHSRALFEEARRMEENLRKLSNQILHAQEEERKRISRELHDVVGQALTAVSVTVASLRPLGLSEATAFGRKVSEVQRLVQQTMELVHHFAFELRPAALDELGLIPAMRSCLKGFAERSGLRVHFRASLQAEQLGSEPKTVLFRVAQESLTNVAKHARASRVSVTLSKRGGEICLEITDDGRSFQTGSTPASRPRPRLGLLGMQERVRLVNGSFAVKSRPGKGTTIRATVPLHPRLSPSPARRSAEKSRNRHH